MADDISLHYFNAYHGYSSVRESLQIEVKSDLSPVTQADCEIESKIRKILAKDYPHIQVIGEEFGTPDTLGDTQLIIDPIDGTKNFIAGIPFFGSLMAIQEKGKIVASMVSMPRYRERWWAIAGQGSFYNGHKIRVSSVQTLGESMAFHSSFSGEKAKQSPQGLLPLLNATKRQRGYGDFYAHMMVAMGCGEFAYDCNLKIWDIAPLKLIVEEAGGIVTDQWGQNRYDTGTILSSNGQFHTELVQRLAT